MNVVFILSDQHNPFFTGCYGHPIAETPAIDRIARDGVRFQNAYCSSPLCVPTRAALFTGRYVFENACWDNCIAWDGKMRGWPHFFNDNNVSLTTIGKLDFAPDVDHGIETELMASHRRSRDIHSLYRENPDNPPRWQHYQQMNQSGPRADLTIETFNDYKVGTRACEWLQNERPAHRPWVLNVNYTQPHPGWPCPPALWEKWNARVKIDDLPDKHFESLDSLHPRVKITADHQTGSFATPEDVRRGYAAYLAHCEMVDLNVQRVIDNLESLGILDETLVMYASDHGENVRAHGIWGKMNMYEDGIRVPFCMMGPDIKPGAVETSPVSHLDIFPTICDAVGVEPPADFRGISLLAQAKADPDAARNEFILSEYHANGSPFGTFAVSDGRYKYVEFVGERGMMFDLKNDPDEFRDLLKETPSDKDVIARVKRMRGWLCGLCSPQGVDVHAKRDQAALRKEMDADGTLVKEVVKRGYEARTDRLVVRDELIPDRFRGERKHKGE